MKYRLRETDDVVIIDITGRLMGGVDAEVFRNCIYQLLEKDKKKIVVNLGKVSWINSGGMGILITGYTTMRKHNGDLKLLNVSNKIQSLLYVTKLNLIFECFESEEEAVKSYR